MGQADEVRLRAALAAGRDEAFVELIRDYGPAMYRAALTILGDRDDADEAVQETLLAIVRARRLLPAVENLRAYLFATLRNAAIALITRRTQQQRALQSLVDRSPRTRIREPHESPAEIADQLRTAVAQLPLEQREVISLKYDAGLTFSEIGRLLAINPHTAASRYRYAIERLRSQLKGSPT